MEFICASLGATLCFAEAYSPQSKGKFLSNHNELRLLSLQDLNNAFLHRVDRKVKNDCTVSIDNKIYEVPTQYVGNKSYQFNQALSRLDFLKQNKGFGLITGESGAGKSSLLRYFKENLNTNLFKCVYIPLTTLTVMDFYRSLCDGLGVEPACKKVTIFKQIQESIYSLNVFNFCSNKRSKKYN